MPEKRIQLVVHTGTATVNCEIVRLTSEAAVKLAELVRRTGLPAKEIASQIVVQGADLVEILEVP